MLSELESRLRDLIRSVVLQPDDPGEATVPVARSEHDHVDILARLQGQASPADASSIPGKVENTGVPSFDVGDGEEGRAHFDGDTIPATIIDTACGEHISHLRVIHDDL
ncbi:MAG TPA: hypothetical protein VJX67_06755 [Blastocatellia bacterium]|nr:hypothetical protein [Blastocatellia bacterium]